MGVPERKEREFRRREQEILEAALSLFDRDDWQQVTIDDIAQKAEIGKGTVYLHFPSKEALYARITINYTLRILERLREIDPALPVLERLREAFRIFIAEHLEGSSQHRIVDYCWRHDFQGRLPGALVQEFEEMDRAFREPFMRDLEQAIAAGLVPDKPLPVLVEGVHAALIGAVRLLWGGCRDCAPHAVDTHTFIEAMSDFALAGLRFQDRARLVGDEPCVPSCVAS
jgi:AcrR family transcriptional regulator